MFKIKNVKVTVDCTDNGYGMVETICDTTVESIAMITGCGLLAAGIKAATSVITNAQQCMTRKQIAAQQASLDRVCREAKDAEAKQDK